MIERLIASLVLMAVFAALVRSIVLFRQWLAGRDSASYQLPPRLRREEPALLYFWSAGCAQCAPQERQIEQAKAALHRAGKNCTVVKLNALEERTLAQTMHVMTVPTTVLVGPHGKIAASNAGLTSWRKIVDQYLLL